MDFINGMVVMVPQYQTPVGSRTVYMYTDVHRLCMFPRREQVHGENLNMNLQA